MISPDNDFVSIGDSSDLTKQILFEELWASMNVGSKGCYDWYYSRHALLWHFDFHCRIKETGSPGILCIVCYQFLHHSSEHGTSSVGKHLLANAHMTKLNELTESEVTELTSWMVNDTPLGIQERQGSWGITIVSSQRKFIFDILFLSILTELTDKMLQTGCSGLCNFWISPRHLELLPHVKIGLGSNCREHTSRLELGRTDSHIKYYVASWSDCPPAALATFAGGNTHWLWM